MSSTPPFTTSSPHVLAPHEDKPLDKNKEKNEAKKAAKMEKFLAKQTEKLNLEVSTPKKSFIKSATTSLNSVPTAAIQTLEGEKKDMSLPMAPSYDPIAVEASWYSWWEKEGFFKPEYYTLNPSHQPKLAEGEEETFTIVMPPPNVTGNLHLGHAETIAIEDGLVRWNRMKGKRCLFLPGCDHAGIATQSIVEKKIAKRGLSRFDLGREAFVKEIWSWKDEYASKIFSQIKRMGASADWDRVSFTLDPSINEAVEASFIKLFDDGLITRSNRLSNWCGKLKTSLSDLEVDTMEVAPMSMLEAHNHPKGKKYLFGCLTKVAYPIDGGAEGEEIIVSTTRPETLFADSAICVNPNDSKYTHLHGKMVIHPITGAKMPIILDEAAEADFGTGALKVSPAHDSIDFALGKKHSLAMPVIFDEENCLNSLCGPDFSGLPRYEGREKVVQLLKDKGYFRGEEPYQMTLPVCSRSGDFVEPRLIPQWWLDCQDMAGKALKVVENGSMQIIPKDHEKTWNNWLVNIKDWCLSRQLWWGHRIPAYQILEKGGKAILNENNETQWIVYPTNKGGEGLLEKAKEHLKSKGISYEIENLQLKQDEDVLDTWFSSGLWPFSTLGWPNKNSSDFLKYFPNQLLETGSDIIFFWVARMVMMSLHLTGEIPFSKVFLHAIVRDAHGRKMSKSLGNVIDPIDVIQGISLADLQSRLDSGNLDSKEIKKAKDGQKLDFPKGIPQCGTDALRFGLCSYVSESREINMSVNRIEGYRRFCNKLWNACKFALLKLGPSFIPLSEGDESLLFEKKLLGNDVCENVIHQWILSKLNQCSKIADENWNSFNLMLCSQSIYSFWINDLCDVYIEGVKALIPFNANGEDISSVSSSCSDSEDVILAKQVIYLSLESGLRLLHPIMPFVTEELYQRLPRRPEDDRKSISITPYPKYQERFSYPFAEEIFGKDIYEGIVRQIRSLSAESKQPKGVTIILLCNDFKIIKMKGIIQSLLKSVGNFEIVDKKDDPIEWISLEGTPFEVAFIAK